VNPQVHFEDEADAEYRLAGRWYEDRQARVLRLKVGHFEADARVPPHKLCVIRAR